MTLNEFIKCVDGKNKIEILQGDELRSVKKDTYLNKVSKTSHITYGESRVLSITAVRWRVIQVTIE